MARLSDSKEAASLPRSAFSLRTWLLNRAHSRYANWWLAFFSFADSSFSPLPPDPILAGLCYMRPVSWRLFANIALAASVVGGVFGYALGFFATDVVTSFFTNSLDLGPELQAVAVQFQANAVISLLVAALTPIPFKVFTVSAGLFNINFWLFLLVIIIGRGIRFYLVSWVTARFGQAGLIKFKHHLLWGTILLVLVLLGYWLFF
jgi:membrane protein YqaA with SNARE-associated domain